MAPRVFISAIISPATNLRWHSKWENLLGNYSPEKSLIQIDPHQHNDAS